MFVEFKPLNVQFVIEDKNVADVLRNIADALGDKLGDRRIRGAGASKKIIEALSSHPEIAEELLDIALRQREPLPKAEPQPQQEKKAARAKKTRAMPPPKEDAA